MIRSKTRKCLHCKHFFKPEPKSKKRQRFCRAQDCRRASKKEAQRRWLSKPENRDYFRGLSHIARVQAWRKKHPGYWKLQSKPEPLQDILITQPVETNEDSGEFIESPLQDVLNNQPLVLIGLIAKFTGLTLQDDIASTTAHLKQLGADVLTGGNRHVFQRQGPKNTQTVQLD